MISLDSILQNEQFKSVLSKVGVSSEQAKKVAQQALGTVQANHKANPAQMASLLSDNPNTPEDESLKSKVENDFVGNLIKKVGLPESVAKQVQGAMPNVMDQIKSKLSSDGKNSQSGVDSLMGSLNSFLDKDKDGKADGIFGKILGFFKK